MEKYDSKAETLLNPQGKEELQAWLKQNGLVLIDEKAIQNLDFVDFECMGQKFTATKIHFLEKAIDYEGKSIM